MSDSSINVFWRKYMICCDCSAAQSLPVLDEGVGRGARPFGGINTWSHAGLCSDLEPLFYAAMLTPAGVKK